MLFNSKLFMLAFLPLALSGFFAVGRSAAAAKFWLLAGSLVFYAAGNPLFLLVLLGSIGANFSVARRLACGAGRGWLVAGLAGNLLCLGVFKYAGFLAAFWACPRPSAVFWRRSGSVFSPFSR